MNNLNVSAPRILVYQDEYCQVLIDFLRFHGYKVIESNNSNILELINEKDFDLCIMGHYKCPIPGDLRLLKAMRKSDEKSPILFVSDLANYDYVFEAFDEGADDYVIRPYNMEELIRRVKALLRRCGTRVRSIQSAYQIGRFVFKVSERTLELDHSITSLTIKESQTLALLCAYKNELLPKKVLMENVWSDDNYFNKRSLDVHMCGLRSYLKKDNTVSIKTKRGIGYMLVVEE